MKLNYFYKCQCGAYTINFTDDNKNKHTIHTKVLKDLNRLGLNLTFCKSLRTNNVLHCGYCNNGWGLDLCGCGSGKKFGKCKEQTEECNQPAESIDLDYVSPIQWFKL